MSLLEKATLITTPTAHSNGTLHSIKGGAVADFDVVRGSAATRVNAEGLIEDISILSGELITNGDFSDGSTDWVLATNWSISGGKAVSNGASGNLYQIGAVAPNKKYKIQATVSDYVSGNVEVSAGAVPRGTMSANGTYTFYQTASTTTNFFIISNTFSGSIDNISIVEVIDATNIPRIDYTTGEGVVLLEPQSTNLTPYSEDFSQWSAIGSPTITSNYGISPDGTQNADRLQMNTNDRIYTSLSASGNTAFSVYLKGSGIITLRDSSSAYKQDVTLTSEWERYSLYFNDTSNTVQIQNTKVGDVDCEIWGAQVEALSYATSYIPTSGAIATRLADSVTGAGDATTFNSTEGVLYFEGSALSNDLTDRDISISDGTNNNVVRIRFSRFSNNIGYYVLSGGTTSVGALKSGIIQVDTNKIAFKYSLNNFSLWINGVEVATDISGNTPVGLDTLQFTDGNGLVLPFFGKVKALAVFNEALTDVELECLTTI